MIPFATLNAIGRAQFVATLGGIFEHSPWVAERAFMRRPFAGVEDLHRAMCDAVTAATTDEKLALIRAHPELAGKAAIRGELTDASTKEQSGAGLSQCSPEEYDEITDLNARYNRRFGFPFILAVRGHTRGTILAAMRTRVANERDAEISEALRQIERIALFRLADLLGPGGV